MKAKKGISLIVLVITIIVIIILAGAVILNLTKNNPMDSAKVARLVSEREALESATLMYVSKITVATEAAYSTEQLLTNKDAASASITGVPASLVTGTAQSLTLGTGDDAITITKAYKLDTTKLSDTIDIKSVSTGTGTWYVDVETGKYYLVVSDYATWMGADASGNLTDSTVASFVVKKTITP